MRCLDLKTAEGSTALAGLLAGADLLLTSSRPSALAALGLGWAGAGRAVSETLAAPGYVPGGAVPGYNVYPSRDGHIAPAVLEPRFWQRLLAALGTDGSGANAVVSSMVAPLSSPAVRGSGGSHGRENT